MVQKVKETLKKPLHYENLFEEYFMRSRIGHMATFCSNQHNITQLNSCYIIWTPENNTNVCDSACKRACWNGQAYMNMTTYKSRSAIVYLNSVNRQLQNVHLQLEVSTFRHFLAPFAMLPQNCSTASWFLPRSAKQMWYHRCCLF